MYIPISEARKTLNNLVGSEEHTIITVNGKPKSVLLKYDVYIRMLRADREREDNKAIKEAEAYISGEKKALSQKELGELLKKGK